MAQEAFKFSGDDALNYEQYLGPLLFETSALELVARLPSYPVRDVLEISCGTGRLTRHLRSHFSQGTRLLASDISPDMLNSARMGLQGLAIDFQVADACALPFAAESFDLVVCQHGMMFWPDKLQGFKEALRVLRPGGRFVFATWAATTDMPLFEIILEDLVIPFFPKEDQARFRLPFSLHDPEKLNGFFKESGFADDQVSTVEFKSGESEFEQVINGLFLKHPLSRQVADKDPSMVLPMAESMKKKLTERFGPGPVQFDLKMLVGNGKK